jgi:uncharacterized NAD-dependent epimerase/dehydratase family protein
MKVGAAILDLAREERARTLFVVGIGKNVGKTVTLRAAYEAACDAGLRVGLISIGRDGEAVDAGDSVPKPRLFLRPGTAIATAREALPRSPAAELLDLSPLQTAIGPLVYARVAHAAYYELVGPPTASGIRSALDVLGEYGDMTLVDGAIDRVAALAGGDGAIVVAGGAAAAGTMLEAVEAMHALVQRLAVARYDPNEDRVRIEGALTPARAAQFIASRETRQIVVRDPTQIAMSGRAALHAFARLRVRCERPLRVIATTVASIGRERSFEPRAFVRAVAEATGLPAFDVYAGECAA